MYSWAISDVFCCQVVLLCPRVQSWSVFSTYLYSSSAPTYTLHTPMIQWNRWHIDEMSTSCPLSLWYYSTTRLLDVIFQEYHSKQPCLCRCFTSVCDDNTGAHYFLAQSSERFLKAIQFKDEIELIRTLYLHIDILHKHGLRQYSL